MPQENNSHRFNWRKSPRPAAPQAEQPPADTGEEIGEGTLFQGMLFDPESDLTNFRHRAYSPTVQPWANHDPAGYVDGLNAYQATADNPINAVNPLGVVACTGET